MDAEFKGTQKVLVANRGEIAVRIFKSTKKLGLRSVAIYTQADATAPHVILADEAVALLPYINGTGSNDANAYLNIEAIVTICQEHGVTLVHPGYGFLSENAAFVRRLAEKNITLIGPGAQTIEDMGLKHRARMCAVEAGVPVVPGSDGLLTSVEDAEQIAESLEYPVMLKATAGGGGVGLSICRDVDDLRKNMETTQQRAKTLFQDGGVFLEKYIHASRHIEVQIFGDGSGHVIHMGERECSVQRRHQKLIEEAPSPYLVSRPDLRSRMCASAVNLGRAIKYKSAGTVEFLVDDDTGAYYFLEMNTRLQVEHGVTEMLYSVDLVSLMLLQGLHERFSGGQTGVSAELLDQHLFERLPGHHVMELRVYAESPSQDFMPCPGILQRVSFPEADDTLRIDTWVSTGTTITSSYDPLLAKLVYKDTSRAGVIRGLVDCIRNDVVIQGPPNNIPFLNQILNDKSFQEGRVTSDWIDRGNVQYIPSSLTVISPGIETTVQALPVRDTGLGIPPSGPMDTSAFQIGNLLVGSTRTCEGLSFPLAFVAQFHVQSTVAVTGSGRVFVDEEEKLMWSRLSVRAGAKLRIISHTSGGLRCYLAVYGGFPDIPKYLGSKSTSMGMGGIRPLRAGDVLAICPSVATEELSLPASLVPKYPTHWTLYAARNFYADHWKVSSASNRMGIRLEVDRSDSSGGVLQWARQSGGEGGSHPSNILDNGYARGCVNLNGDTPVILTVEGPSMGGYLCISTVASSDQWKFGQLRPGNTVEMHRITYQHAMSLRYHYERWLDAVESLVSGATPRFFDPRVVFPEMTARLDPKLHVSAPTAHKPRAGDSAILVEYGDMTLDLTIRARIHALEAGLRSQAIRGIKEIAPCIRSTMIHFDNTQVSQADVLSALLQAERSLPDKLEDIEFRGRKIMFPIVLDDRWTKETLRRYMQSARSEAAYLPSNVDYLAANNGIEGGSEETLKLLVSSPWLVLGVGFYLACPFLIPVHRSRARLVAQKMNPSRTYTPRGAVGIAGLVAAIYPVESPGGYQLFGRTLPTWDAWGKGPDFDAHKPWLLEAFDQVVFEPISETRYEELEQAFDSGRYEFKIEPTVFSMKHYLDFISSVEKDVSGFKTRQKAAVIREEAREAELLKLWRIRKPAPRTRHKSRETSYSVSAILAGSVSKLNVAIGDIIEHSDQPIVVLEAMKTEIAIAARESNVGRRVSGFGHNVSVGQEVQAGDRLVYLEEV
ncbi:hypothetical protein BDZ89DRAFT_1092541 [Hymenopellis radicata]|nr:hypothetical protein BDZ89DRAFT_1092541 [Hymenopellis radicata]